MKGFFWNMQLLLLAIVQLWLCFPPGARGGKVLVFPLDGSHWVNMKILIEELHSRGHNVTVIRASSSWYLNETSPHYTPVVIPDTVVFDESFFDQYLSRLLQLRREGAYIWTRLKLEMDLYFKLHSHMSDLIVKMFEDHKLIQSLREAKYDLVLTDPAVGGGVMLAHHLGLPLVFNVRWTAQGEAHFILAPSPLSYCPFPGAELTDKMNFFQRVQNLFASLFGHFQIELITRASYTSVCRRYFGPEVDFLSLFQAADIWLMRNDFVFEFPRPTMPNIVYIAGFQCKPSKPLPQDLEDFVSSSGEHGIIIMSLGTLIGQLPRDVTDEMAAAFSMLPQKVIWRHIGEKPANLGNNTLLVDWMPQNDLLGHPKTRAFVTHGGTNGLQEAIYHGVPLVGFPLVFDQPDNLSRMKAKGVAKLVDITTIDRKIFLEATKEVLNDPSYRTNMQKLSMLHHDQPMKPLDRAIFWIEFVMRHKGASHLRTESYKMPWYVYYSVDVMLVLLAALVIILLCIFAFIKFVCYRLWCRKKVKSE
ncbi:UDP-glucuronosyltransferase 2A1-like [Brienomyrus brachyistius]|uniref:UDP-glucuronosyltransferase 2A1-like n=1 Tax=Brienomyrus brachyistius TaxID=42636 RepID=UPI0020B1C430|nr:UDP-glucuronosyltransferase 2A1-like [Brienomyrus brachyistius]XP_048829213.1 UDP-glucuronosyltransferase 2A1-like [Brienomyrus brachyistius]